MCYFRIFRIFRIFPTLVPFNRLWNMGFRLWSRVWIVRYSRANLIWMLGNIDRTFIFCILDYSAVVLTGSHGFTKWDTCFAKLNESGFLTFGINDVWILKAEVGRIGCAPHEQGREFTSDFDAAEEACDIDSGVVFVKRREFTGSLNAFNYIFCGLIFFVSWLKTESSFFLIIVIRIHALVDSKRLTAIIDDFAITEPFPEFWRDGIFCELAIGVDPSDSIHVI